MKAHEDPLAMSPILLLVIGFVLLIAGAEALVRGASRLAALFGVSPLIIGLTIVACGTSAPELAVSVASTSRNLGDIAVGNILGSNILNVLLILGLSALVAPLNVARQLVRMDVPVVILVSLAAWAMAFDGNVGTIEGLALFAALVVYMFFLVRQGRVEKVESTGPVERSWRTGALNGVLILAGLGLLVYGSDLLVDGATAVAKAVGVSDLVIGLTVVALGTSLPELATSVLASIRGERDIAVGNVVGSNLFNLTAVLGAAAVAAPGGIGVGDQALRFDFPIAIAASVACLPIFFTGHRIDRWEGALFLMYYAAYTAYIIAASVGGSPVDEIVRATIWFVLPLTVVTLAVLGLREMRRPDFGEDA